jgi:hypothetical protein
LFGFLLLPLLSLLADSLEVTTPSCDAQLVYLHCLLRLQALEDLRQQETTSYLHTIVTCSTLYFGLNPQPTSPRIKSQMQVLFAQSPPFSAFPKRSSGETPAGSSPLADASGASHSGHITQHTEQLVRTERSVQRRDWKWYERQK